MPKITKANQGELDMFQHAKPKPRVLPGHVIRDLFDHFNIGGNFAAQLAGFYLGYSAQTVQAMMSRTIRTNDYELLRHMLVMWKAQRIVDDNKTHKWGKKREDGQFHRHDDWKERQAGYKANNREYMRRIRAQDKSKWRKPKAIGVKDDSQSKE